MNTRIVTFLFHPKMLSGFTALVVWMGVSLYLYSMTIAKPKPLQLTDPVSLLIISTHQDDGVISGGGMAIVNDRLGGSTKIAYILRPTSDEERAIRYQEAQNAWHLLKNNSATLEFFDIYPEQLTTNYVKQELVQRLNLLIERVSPDAVIFPLEERGQRHHDLVARAGNVIKEENIDAAILDAAEYNPLLLTDHMPEKLLMFFVRLLPFVPYYTPNSGIDKNNQTEIILSESELALKKEMLLAFESQRDVIPLSQFGYPDIFDTSKISEYSGIELMGKTFSITGIIILAILAGYFFYVGAYIGSKNLKPAARISLYLIAIIPFGIGLNYPVIFKEDFLLLAISSVGFFTTSALHYLFSTFLNKGRLESYESLQ